MKKTIGGIAAASVITVGGSVYLNNPKLQVDTVVGLQIHTDASGDPVQTLTHENGTAMFARDDIIIDIKNPRADYLVLLDSRIKGEVKNRCALLLTTKDKADCVHKDGAREMFDRQ